MDRESIYLRLPRPLQELALGIEGLRIRRGRYGREYPELERVVVARRQLEGETLRRYQRGRLGALLRAAARSPFWQERFREHGVLPDAPDPIRELAKLAVLARAEVKGAAAEILDPSVDRRDLISRHTSGTTGSGLVFFVTTACEREIWATWWRHRYWHGVDRETLCGYFGGRSVVPLRQQSPPFWRMNRPGRQLMFSAYHLGAKTAAAYIEALRAAELEWLHGYPSLLALLSHYVTERGMEVPSVRLISCGGESLTEHQRERIEHAFPGARVVQCYGQAEGVANISQCTHDSLHVDEDFSWVEFVPVEGVAHTFRIIGSNWTNPAFPLLRYDTGDVVRLDESPCACGSHWRRVATIDGRIEDFVVLPGGARVGRLDHVFKDLVNVSEAQIRQEDPSELLIAVVKGRGYSERDERALLAEARKRLGNEIGLRVSYVGELPRTAAGKVRLVVSRIPGASNPGP